MLYTIKNEQLSVTVESLGAELQSILGCDGTEYLWQGDPKYWSGRALNIFPYVARLNDGQYEIDGQRHSMRIHGIAPYMQFEVTEHTDTHMVFTLASNDETYAAYPRAFVFRIVYELKGNALETVYLVENKDDKTMYFGIGGHPGFNVPLKAGKRFEDYRLRFTPACEPLSVGLTPTCFVDGTCSPFALEDGCILPLAHNLFDHDAIVLKNMSREITIESDDGPSVTVRFPGMQYLGIWHMPHTAAPYVCIEPWCSLPAKQDEITVFEKQEDLISLEAGKTYENIWHIIIGKEEK